MDDLAEQLGPVTMDSPRDLLESLDTARVVAGNALRFAKAGRVYSNRFEDDQADSSPGPGFVVRQVARRGEVVLSIVGRMGGHEDTIPKLDMTHADWRQCMLIAFTVHLVDTVHTTRTAPSAPKNGHVVGTAPADALLSMSLCGHVSA